MDICIQSGSPRKHKELVKIMFFKFVPLSHFAIKVQYMA